jgi:hypothetical protein
LERRIDEAGTHRGGFQILNAGEQVLVRVEGKPAWPPPERMTVASMTFAEIIPVLPVELCDKSGDLPGTGRVGDQSGIIRHQTERENRDAELFFAPFQQTDIFFVIGQIREEGPLVFAPGQEIITFAAAEE